MYEIDLCYERVIKIVIIFVLNFNYLKSGKNVEEKKLVRVGRCMYL